jgi:hypothetical protein
MRGRKPPSPTWRSFLKNHLGDIAAVDFFTIPTAFFRVLYVFVVLRHDHRRVVHFHVTAHPTSAWVTQQLREAFPFDQVPRFLIDRQHRTASLVAIVSQDDSCWTSMPSLERPHKTSKSTGKGWIGDLVAVLDEKGRLDAARLRCPAMQEEDLHGLRASRPHSLLENWRCAKPAGPRLMVSHVHGRLRNPLLV